jgi:hypothetical protein
MAGLAHGVRNPAPTHIRTACGGNPAVLSPLSPLAVLLLLKALCMSGCASLGFCYLWSL